MATGAFAFLFAIEWGLDFERGGEVSKTLARLYQGARQTVINASLGSDPGPFLEVADNLEEIAEAWRQVRAG
jgi:flagellar protein FliS